MRRLRFEFGGQDKIHPPVGQPLPRLARASRIEIEMEIFAVQHVGHLRLEAGEFAALLGDDQREQHQRTNQHCRHRRDPRGLLIPRHGPRHPGGRENGGLQIGGRTALLAYLAAERGVDAALARVPHGEFRIAIDEGQRLLHARVRRVLPARAARAENEFGFLDVHGCER